MTLNKGDLGLRDDIKRLEEVQETVAREKQKKALTSFDERGRSKHGAGVKQSPSSTRHRNSENERNIVLSTHHV